MKGHVNLLAVLVVVLGIFALQADVANARGGTTVCELPDGSTCEGPVCCFGHSGDGPDWCSTDEEFCKWKICHEDPDAPFCEEQVE